jgi:hypothetical protein
MKIEIKTLMEDNAMLGEGICVRLTQIDSKLSYTPC